MPITYPRNTDSRYIRYNTKDKQSIGEPKKYPNLYGDEVSMEEDMILLEIVTDPDPTYDSTTEKLVSEVVIDEENGQYINRKTKEPLTNAELKQRTKKQAEQDLKRSTSPIEQMVLIFSCLDILLENVDTQSLDNDQKQIVTKTKQLGSELKIKYKDIK